LHFVGKRKVHVFKNKIPRKICGPQEDKVSGQFRLLHFGEFRDCTGHLVLLEL